MILSNFSSFLEVITGVYISMGMDDVLKGIWSPKYYDELESVLKENYLDGHDEFIERIVKTNTEKAESIKNYMKNRAIFLFATCLILLLLCGYESIYDSTGTEFGISMFFLVFWVAVLLLFNRFFFSTKQRTAFAIGLLMFLSAITYQINQMYIHWEISSTVLVVSVLVTLILPVLWQTFMCWMFSSAYKGYIRHKLVVGKKNYELAKRGLDEHNPDIIPKRYKDIYTKVSIQSENAEQAKNNCLDHYLELMENEIAQASDPKSVFKIFGSWLLFQMKAALERFAFFVGLKKPKTISQTQS